MEQYKEILENLGYKLQDRGKEWRAKPLYRESDNDTSLRIRKKDGMWMDFGGNTGGPFERLVKITLGLATDAETKKWLEGTSFHKIVPLAQELEIEYEENFSVDELNDLVPSYEYWAGRGISKLTLDTFKGGIIKKGVGSSFYNRYIFPIFDSRKNCIGFAGRWLGQENGKAPRWKLAGPVNRWCHPAIINKDHILKEKKIVLVESMGDFLSLWEAGVKYGLVLFGVNLGKTILKTLIAANPDEIIISTNNDIKNNFVGNKAAEVIKKQLTNFFDPEQIRIMLPETNDWGDSDVNVIQKNFGIK
jgi:hypothetical protein